MTLSPSDIQKMSDLRNIQMSDLPNAAEEILAALATGATKIQVVDTETYPAGVIEILGDNAQMAVDPNWAHIYPYSIEVLPGDKISFELCVENWLKHDVDVRFDVVGGDLIAQKDYITSKAGAGELVKLPFEVKVPHDCEQRRHPIAVDITFDGRRLGQIAEAIIIVKSED